MKLLALFHNETLTNVRKADKVPLNGPSDYELAMGVVKALIRPVAGVGVLVHLDILLSLGQCQKSHLVEETMEHVEERIFPEVVPQSLVVSCCGLCRVDSEALGVIKKYWPIPGVV